jgi:hypothetical protein
VNGSALTSREMQRKVGRAWIGVSGYDYPHWGKGAFYPKDLPRRSWLPYADVVNGMKYLEAVRDLFGAKP